MGTTDRFVLIRLQAELAQPLDVLKGGKHVVKVSLHAAELKGAAVEGVVQIQHPGLAVLGLRVAFQHTVLLDQQPVGSLLLAGQAAPDPVQKLFFQREARKLLHLHQLQINGSHIGAALGLDGHHVGNVEHDQCLPHGGAADAQFLGQLVVVQFIPGFELHGDDPAADGFVGCLAGAPNCHTVFAPFVLLHACYLCVLLIYQFHFYCTPHTLSASIGKLPKLRTFSCQSCRFFHGP